MIELYSKERKTQAALSKVTDSVMRAIENGACATAVETAMRKGIREIERRKHCDPTDKQD